MWVCSFGTAALEFSVVLMLEAVLETDRRCLHTQLQRTLTCKDVVRAWSGERRTASRSAGCVACRLEHRLGAE